MIPFLRRLEHRLGGRLRALADNERYPAQEVSAEEASQINAGSPHEDRHSFS